MVVTAQHAELVTHAGFMPKGNDVHHATMTLEDAQAWCLAHVECSGFTYQSTDPAPGGEVGVWFKSVDKVAPGAGWHSCVKGGGSPSRADKGPMRALVSACTGGPKAPAPGSLKPACAGLALMTRRPLHFERWLRYHMGLGVSHFFVHVEDTPELLPFLQAEPYASCVTLSHKGDNASFKDNYWTLQDRQRAHVNASLARCREMGIEWLFHVDDDELIWLDKPLREVVAAAPRGVTNITFSNLEAIPTSIERADYFERIRRFTKKRMLAYVNGKPLGRALPGVKLDGPHRFSGASYAVPVTDGVILHYESCDFEQWCTKFRNQVDCSPERKAAIPFPYYRDSITLFQQHPDPARDMPKWVDFYTRRKISHYDTAEIRTAARTIAVAESTRMIDPWPGAAAGGRADAGGSAALMPAPRGLSAGVHARSER